MSAEITGLDEFGLPKISDEDLSSRLNRLTQNFDHLFKVSDKIDVSIPPPILKSPYSSGASTPAPELTETKEEKKSKAKEKVKVYSVKPEKNPNSIKKWTREWMWDFLERQNVVLSDFPRPCFHEIPNILNACDAALLFSKTKTFESAKVILISPCHSLTYMRELALRKEKILYLRTSNYVDENVFTRLDKTLLKKPGDYILASKKKGFKSFGKPVKCRSKSSIDPIDLMIVGSVAVNSSGARIGDGTGFDDLDWAVLYELGAVTKSTTIVTLVDSVQILDDKVLPNSVMDRHDIPVDVMVSKKVIHHVQNRLRKPDKGVLSHLLSKKRLNECPALKFFL